MSDEPIHVSTEEDMAVYDALPYRLRRYLDEAPLGLDATTVAVFYEKKKLAAWGDDDDPVQMTISTLNQYIRMQGVTDFRPLVARRKLKGRHAYGK